MTLRELLDQISFELGDAFTTATEDNIRLLVNSGLRFLARTIVQTKEDYFIQRVHLTPTQDPIAENPSYLTAPSDLYAHKIRQIGFYINTTYFQLRELHLEEVLVLSDTQHQATVPYGWYIQRAPGQSIEQPRILIYPTRVSTFIDQYLVWYTSEVAPLVLGTDRIPIPESYDFLISFVKRRLAMVDSTLNITDFLNDEARELQVLLESLADRTPRDGGDLLLIPQDIQEVSRNIMEDY